MDKELLFSLALIAMLLSACIFNGSNKEEVIEQVSSLPEVKEFLTKYPDAEIRAKLLGREVIEDNIENIRYYCGPGMEIKSYWDVVIERGEKGWEIWVDEEGKIACILKKGREEPTTTTSSTTTSTTTTTLSKNLKVHFIDVGEGEAILLEKEGKFGLIDCGNYYQRVYLYLFKRNISRLEFLIVTNPKAQHLGACDVILENFQVKEILDNGQSYSIEPYREYIKLAHRGNYQVVYKGHQINFDEVKLEFLWPPVSRPSGNIEKNSLVIKLTYGGVNFLLTSDCDTSCENLLAGDLKADILKVGHQGSILSTSPAFLNKVEPSVAIIPVGYGNIYGHPSSATLSKLRGVEVHRTDLEGSIVIETNGENYLVFPEHEPTIPTTTLPPPVTTTTSTSTTTTTSTTTSTTVSSTSTSTTTTTTTTITSTSTSTSTTLCQVACCGGDCPADLIVKNYTCSGKEIMTQYIHYYCQYAGSPSSKCIGTIKLDFIKSCEGENERCLEDEPYCAFTAQGEYYLTSQSPWGSDDLFVNDNNFHQYLDFWIKIKYVISDLKGISPDGLCIYVKDSQWGDARREYLTDKFFGNWINDSVRIGIKKIAIGDSGTSAELWGIK